MSNLESLSIIMETFDLYDKKEKIKENMFASMKLKVMAIEDALRDGSKYK